MIFLVILVCKHGKSTMPCQINCILGMHFINNEYMIPIVWGEVNCHNEVNSGVTLENREAKSTHLRLTEVLKLKFTLYYSNRSLFY